MFNELEKVCVIITYFEQSASILNSMESVFAQKYNFGEVIVVDDCSTKEPFRETYAFKKFSNQISLLELPVNKGVSNAINEAIGLARSEFILILNGDDTFNQFFSELIHIKEVKLNNSALYFGDAIIVGKRAANIVDKYFFNLNIKGKESNFYWNFANYPGTPIVTTIFSKKIFNAIGGFQELPGLPEDAIFFNKTKDFEFVYLDFPFIYYTIDDISQRNFQKNKDSIILSQAYELVQEQLKFSKLYLEYQSLLNSFTFRLIRKFKRILAKLFK
jgi:glycosyltransferase involved in cell wall biosynthesis